MPSTAFLYVESDVPDGMTLTEWRTRRLPEDRRPPRRPLRRLGRFLAS
jgi:hypothetical protein